MESNHTDQALEQAALAVASQLKACGRQLATAESCTGGWIAKVLTDVAGSSAWFDRGVVTYSNDAKAELLGVKEATLASYGAVSEEVAAQMADGVRLGSGVDYGLSTTGIAGPGGGSADKPVGTVCFGWALPDGIVETECHLFGGDREAVRRLSVICALRGLVDRINRSLTF